MAESSDGIHFERPELGLFEHAGSKANNIIWTGEEAHCFAPFLDQNPDAAPDARYKALTRNMSFKIAGETGQPGGLLPLASGDGIHWRKLREEPVITDGKFDSLNVAFWDAIAGAYRCYSRYLENEEDPDWHKRYRAIQSCTSTDFLEWGEQTPNRYSPELPWEHLYTSATTPCPGAEHIYLAFPKRFMRHRTKVECDSDGVSDALFMTSRDGVNWDRTFREAWVRPGPDPRLWVHRNNMPCWHILTLSPDEHTMYIHEHSSSPTSRLRRLTVGRHRFASMNAPFAGGEFTTVPLVFEGKRLILNYATSAAGLVRVELQDAHGHPLPGFEAGSFELFGDEFDRTAEWGGKSDLSSLAGKPVRLRFLLKDADVYAIRFEG